jgi:hypothetical protein
LKNCIIACLLALPESPSVNAALTIPFQPQIQFQATDPK